MCKASYSTAAQARLTTRRGLRQRVPQLMLYKLLLLLLAMERSKNMRGLCSVPMSGCAFV